MIVTPPLSPLESWTTIGDWTDIQIFCLDYDNCHLRVGARWQSLGVSGVWGGTGGQLAPRPSDAPSLRVTRKRPPERIMTLHHSNRNSFLRHFVLSASSVWPGPGWWVSVVWPPTSHAPIMRVTGQWSTMDHLRPPPRPRPGTDGH